MTPTRRDLLAGAAATGALALAPRAASAEAPARIALVSTSVAEKPDGRPTGLWMAELTTPYWAFVDAGLSVALASIAGGEPPVDPRSLEGPRGRGPSVERFGASASAMRAFSTMPALTALDAADFEAVFLCGGHGTMWDFQSSTTLAAFVEAIDRRGGVVGAVCHGPAGLLGATTAEGRPLVEGRRVTGFTDSEEAAVGLADAVPYLLETELRARGARFEAAADFRPHAVRDGRLVTGQNPASAGPAAALVLDALAERTKRPEG